MLVEQLSALLSESFVATVAVNLEYNIIWQNNAFAHRFLSHETLRDILAMEFKVSPVDADVFITSEDDYELTTKLDHVYHIKKNTIIEHSLCIVSFESSVQRGAADFRDTFFDKIFAGSQQPIVVFSYDSADIKYFNLSFSDVLGLPPVYIANAKKHLLYTEAVEFIRSHKSKDSRKFMVTSTRLDGDIVFLEVFPTLMAVDGEEVLILKIADMTEKHSREIEKCDGDRSQSFPFVQHDLKDAMIVSENNIVIDANVLACKIWGYNAPEDMVGRHIKEFVKKEYVDKFYNSGESEWVSFIGINNDLRQFKAEKNNKLMISHNNAVYITLVRALSGVGQSHDVAFYMGLLDAQHNPVMIYDNSGKLVRCNRGLLDLFKCCDTDDFKRKYVDISRQFVEEGAFMSFAKYGDDWYMAPYRDPRKEYLIKVNSNDGEPKIFSVSTNMVENFDAVYAVTSLTDVTETVQQTYILKDVNNILKDQYEDISVALSDNIATLMQQSKLATMGEMIGVISHQWKQPLNTIGLIAQNVEDMVEDKDDAISHEEISLMMQSIMKHVLFMSETVDNFRDFFRKNTQRLFFPITNAIDSTLNLVSPIIEKSHIVIEKKFPENYMLLYLFAFPNDFKQVLMNILINGMDSINAKIKAGQAPEGSGKIVISISKTNTYEAALTVSDNGLGLSENAVTNIFKMNFTTKGSAGTGLGLYMSKKIIDSIGGEIAAQNHSCGAEIIIRLPVFDKAISKRR